MKLSRLTGGLAGGLSMGGVSGLTAGFSFVFLSFRFRTIIDCNEYYFDVKLLHMYFGYNVTPNADSISS